MSQTRHVFEGRDAVALRWFIDHVDVAVVQATPYGITSYVTRDLRDALDDFHELDLAAADTALLSNVTGRAAECDDVAVFCRGALAGVFRPPLNGLTYAELLDERILATKDSGRRERQRRAWINRILACAVEAPSTDEPAPTEPSTSEDPFDVLGVPPTADPKSIRVAHRRLVDACHPDRFERASTSMRKAAEEETKRVNAAFDMIKRSWDSPAEPHAR
jgi:DnaJ-domain-containing protein 1